MRTGFLLMVAALPLAACASQPGMMVESGVPRGSLAVAAIDRGDLPRAERLLAHSSLSENDPARLINLGYVLMEQGRRDEAIAVWQRAAAAPSPYRVATLSGREVRTDEHARQVLLRYLASVQIR